MREWKHLPQVLLVGGPDIDARLELMHRLKDAFNISVLGSQPTIHDRFLAEGFSYSSYRLSRQVNPLSEFFTAGQLVFILRKLKPQTVHPFDVVNNYQSSRVHPTPFPAW